MFRALSKAIRTNVLLGLALLAPVGLTLLIANWLFVLVTNAFLTDELESSANQLLLRLGALLLAVAICFLVGFFARSYLGRHTYRVGDKLLTRLPIINRIYVQIRHISEVLVAQRETLFDEVVLVEYPRRGLFSMAFVTAPIPPAFSKLIHEETQPNPMVSLFIPTTPNPTSGLMIMAPRSDLKTLDIEVADAMKFIVSAGAVHPDTEPAGKTTDLLDKLEAWRKKESGDAQKDMKNAG